ncbi:hypothetical protein EVAR_60956_1 [Eumeta japonica]|uniref:Uncharacterized protein n=1 Tax=Eumeta variegata TaxID=151549 RepID=A0A4C1XX96_EUMVA|nr:hypothetical protein EVAR_60956_1 [Eumeta japonica]
MVILTRENHKHTARKPRGVERSGQGVIVRALTRCGPAPAAAPRLVINKRTSANDPRLDTPRAPPTDVVFKLRTNYVHG